MVWNRFAVRGDPKATRTHERTTRERRSQLLWRSQWHPANPNRHSYTMLRLFG
jgi:hypothetical protein